MAFTDQVTIHATAGKGGNGVIRWLRTKETAKGGPSGGDGGRGGDVVLRGVRDLAALATYRREKKFRAENGEAGRNELQHGANGARIVLDVPVGTVARVAETGDEYEITKEDEELILFKGGTGGKGNARFKSSTNQNPFQQTDGKPGKEGSIELSLKIIADAGLIGLPNAGKSSLLNALTRAKSKVGSYAFTTLEPHLGDFYGYIIADIPGLIEGASHGRGLGIKFLKHVERTGILLHLVSASQDDPLSAYMEVRREIEAFGHSLSEKREVIVLSKTDVISNEKKHEMVKRLEAATQRVVMTVSVKNPIEIKMFADRLASMLKK